MVKHVWFLRILRHPPDSRRTSADLTWRKLDFETRRLPQPLWFRRAREQRAKTRYNAAEANLVHASATTPLEALRRKKYTQNTHPWRETQCHSSWRVQATREPGKMCFSSVKLRVICCKSGLCQHFNCWCLTRVKNWSYIICHYFVENFDRYGNSLTRPVPFLRSQHNKVPLGV